MAAPTTSILDAGTSGENPLSTNWGGIIITGDGRLKSASSHITGDTGVSSNSAYRTDISTADSEAYCTVVSANYLLQLWARVQSPGGASAAGYLASISVNNKQTTLYRVLSGALGTPVVDHLGFADYAVNDKFFLRVTGTSPVLVEVYQWHDPGGGGSWGGSPIATYSDSDASRIQTAGAIGLGDYYGEPYVIDFGGGAPVVAGPVTITPTGGAVTGTGQAGVMGFGVIPQTAVKGT